MNEYGSFKKPMLQVNTKSVKNKQITTKDESKTPVLHVEQHQSNSKEGLGLT